MSSLWQVIQNQLEECVQQMGLRGLALANEDGLLIASAGYGVDAELVATVNPLHHSPNRKILAQVHQDLKRDGLRLEICNLQRGEQALFLCATGQEQESNDPELQNILRDVAEKVGL